MLDEISALRYIRDNFQTSSDSVFIGPGDDCAVVEFGKDDFMLITTDCLVQDVHFKKDVVSPTVLGLRAVSVSVSDIAAMGGTPRYYLSSVGLRADHDDRYFREIMNGFKNSSLEYGMDLIGGNLTSSDIVFIDITVLGVVEKDLVIKRAGAREGDILFVTGTLGDSGLGLKMLLENSDQEDGEEKREINSFLVNRHLYPAPRIEVGRRLAKSRAATAMIDISDGLLLDLERITLENGLGADIYLEKIPLSEDYIRNCSVQGNTGYEAALNSGEDYELLFSAPEDMREEIIEISQQTGVRITEIGAVISDRRVNIYDKEGFTRKFEKRGFVHFK